MEPRFGSKCKLGQEREWTWSLELELEVLLRWGAPPLAQPSQVRGPLSRVIHRPQPLANLRTVCFTSRADYSMHVAILTFAEATITASSTAAHCSCTRITLIQPFPIHCKFDRGT